MADDRLHSKWKVSLCICCFIHSMAFIMVSIMQSNVVLETETLDSSLKQKIQKFYESQNTKDDHEVILRRSERASNFIADILAAQEQALAKHCVQPAHPCTAGAPGEQGSRGDIGLKGTKGEPGELGATGNPGQTGPNGNNGEKGQPGSKGQRGQKGVSGVTGVKGLRGEQGLKGVKGMTGLPGIQGISGFRGENGANGTDGLQGDIGARGDQGPRGVIGPKGPKGDPGPRGPAGNDTKMLADGCECLSLPTFTGPEVVYVEDGGNATIPCVVAGQPAPHVVVQKLTSSKRDQSVVKRVLNKQKERYAIQNAGPQDYGKYICSAKNINGNIQKIVTVKKGSLPKIVTHPLDSRLFVGHQINFLCQAVGEPPSVIEYYKDGVKVTSDATHQINDGSLVLTKPTTADAGQYDCRATNGIGTTISTPWNINTV